MFLSPSDQPTPEPPSTVTFDASATTDADGDALYYAWDFGDGNSLFREEDASVVEHKYLEPGSYTVTLEVMDGYGAITTETAQVTVAPRTPNASPVVNVTVSANSITSGGIIDFDASTSTDPDGDSLSYFWQFGDGRSATGAVASHQYSRPGVYNYFLQVTDARGLTTLESGVIDVAYPNEGRAIISINLGDSPINSSFGAGAQSVAFWNSEKQYREDDAFIDSYGSMTSLSLANRLAGGGRNTDYPGEPDPLDGNDQMMASANGNAANLYSRSVSGAAHLTMCPTVSMMCISTTTVDTTMKLAPLASLLVEKLTG